MRTPSECILALLLLAALAAAATPCTAFGSDCPPCAKDQWGTATISIINETNAAFLDNFNKAVKIMETFPGLMSTDEGFAHMTVQYLCCFSLDAYVHLAELLLGIQWEPIPVTYAQVGCNLDDPEHLSYIVWLDQPSQARMMAFVERIEATMVAAGYPVTRPRSTQEPFHTTIGVVDPAKCPAAALLSALNSNITVFSPAPVLIDAFDLAVPPVHFRAHNDTALPAPPRTIRMHARRK